MTFLRKFYGQMVAFAGLAMVYFSPVNAQTMDKIQSTIRGRFPDVRQIPPRTLAEWMGQTNAAGPVLIDTREAAEYGVSQLAGALNCRSVPEVAKVVPDKSTRVVLYCSVGYRSSALSEKLQRAGYTNVFNLEGSIFAWANEGRPVYRGKTELRPARVHPYDRKWGQMLKPELR